jgi:glutamate decarboxylase
VPGRQPITRPTARPTAASNYPKINSRRVSSLSLLDPHLSGKIAKMGPFELFTEGRDLPVFAFKLRADITGYSVFDLSDRLRQRGWQVPAYTFPEDMTDSEVMRIVVRNGFSVDLANLLLDDLKLHVRALEHHPQTQPPPEIQRKRQAFRH